ncbi:hypothetical protein SprV_0301221500 [Sparganum proliferum]
MVYTTATSLTANDRTSDTPLPSIAAIAVIPVTIFATTAKTTIDFTPIIGQNAPQDPSNNAITTPTSTDVDLFPSVLTAITRLSHANA